MEKNKILIDADALIALYKTNDSLHKKTLALSKKIESCPIYISLFTVPEAATVISYDMSQATASDFLRKVRERKLIWLPFEEKIKLLTDDIFLKQNKKGTSWFDCCNVALFRFYQLDAIFSFDKFYKRVGLKRIEELF